MATLGFKFGSYSFSGTGALIYDFDIKSDNRIETQLIPTKDGADIEEAEINPMLVTFRGTLTADTASDLRNKQSDLFKILEAGSQALRIWDDRYATAQKRSFTYDYANAMCYMRFTASFVAENPFWVADTATTNTNAITTATYNYDVNTGGSAYVKPTITITAHEDLTSLSLQNITANERFGFGATVSSGNDLVINTDTYVVTNNAVDAVGDFSGDFFKLLAGTSNLEYEGGKCSLKVEWFDRWY